MRITSAALVLLLFASQAMAAPIIRSGADPDGASANSNAAYALWQGDVGGIFDIETFDTLTIGGGGLSGSTANGNVFDAITSSLSNPALTLGVISGEALGVSRQAASGGFTWSFAEPVNAFGFFSLDNDDGTITVQFNDGTARNYNFGPADSLFWGISNFDAAITSAAITTTDPGGFTYWDNFVTASQVPEPTSIALWGLGALGFVAYRRRRSKASR